MDGEATATEKNNNKSSVKNSLSWFYWKKVSEKVRTFWLIRHQSVHPVACRWLNNTQTNSMTTRYTRAHMFCTITKRLRRSTHKQNRRNIDLFRAINELIGWPKAAAAISMCLCMYTAASAMHGTVKREWRKEYVAITMGWAYTKHNRGRMF